MSNKLLFFSLLLFAVIPFSSAHLDEGEDINLGEYQADFGYAPAQPKAHEQTTLSFGLINSTTHKAISYDSVWIRISSSKDVLFAGTLAPQNGQTLFSMTFPHWDNYIIKARFEKGNRALVETDLDLFIYNDKKNYSPLYFLIGGLLVLLTLVYLHARKQQKHHRWFSKKKIILFILVALLLTFIGWWIMSHQPPSHDEMLLLNLREHENLAFHIHPFLNISINGYTYPIPANLSITPRGMSVIHTHDDTGKLHIEGPSLYQFTLGDFFTLWGRTFNKNCIFDYCADQNHTLTMYVDGKKNEMYEQLPLQDLEHITIVYEEKK